MRTLSDRWSYRSHYDPDIRWCWPRYSTSAGKAANGQACAAVVAICRRSGRGSLLRKPCSGRSTAGVPGERLIVARSRGAKQGSFRAIDAAVKQVGSCAERGRSNEVIRGGMGASRERTLIIARVNKLCRLCRRMTMLYGTPQK